MMKKNKEQDYYRFEFSDGCIDDSSREFVNVPGDITVKELYESGIVGYYMTKTKLKYENTKEIMQSDKYIKPIYTENKEDFYDSDSTFLNNGDIVTLLRSRAYSGDYKVIIKKHNGKILRNHQKKKRNPLNNAVYKIEIQPLEAPTGQLFTLKFPKTKKYNIFKRIWHKIK